jgi:hypothetical protein
MEKNIKIFDDDHPKKMEAPMDVTELILHSVISDAMHSLLLKEYDKPTLKQLQSIVRPIIRLSVVSKEFANIVNTSGVWSLLRKLLIDLDIVPRRVQHIPDTRIASLCLARGCQKCGAKSVRKIYWEMGGNSMGCRLCRDCLERCTIEKYYVEQEFGKHGAALILRDLPSMDVHSYRPKIGYINLTFFWVDDVYSEKMREKRETALENVRKCAEREQAKIEAAKEATILGVKQILEDAPTWTHLFATERVRTDLANRAYKTYMRNNNQSAFTLLLRKYVNLVLSTCIETKINKWMNPMKNLDIIIKEFVSSQEVVSAFTTKFNKHVWDKSEWPAILHERTIIRNCVTDIFAAVKKANTYVAPHRHNRHYFGHTVTCVHCRSNPASTRCTQQQCGICCSCNKHKRKK